MSKWQRFRYQPCLPLGKDGRRVTGSPSHVDLSRKAASEGMVLLKNEGTALPLRKGERVALFGKGSADYVKGGGGSGDVTCAYVRNLCDGMRLKEKEGKVRVFGKLSEFYEQNVRKQLEAGAEPGMTVEPELPEALLQEAREHADTAIITICRFSGEGWDRRTIVNKNDPYRLDPTEQRMFDLSAKIFPDGDFYLTEDEKELVRRVTALFPKVIAVLNVGGMVDSEWFRNDDRIQGAFLAWQGGMEGGLAMADVLTGDVNPSGHLTDTFAKELDDYPSTAGFHKSTAYVDYEEDIYDLCFLYRGGRRPDPALCQGYECFADPREGGCPGLCTDPAGKTRKAFQDAGGVWKDSITWIRRGAAARPDLPHQPDGILR